MSKLKFWVLFELVDKTSLKCHYCRLLIATKHDISWKAIATKHHISWKAIWPWWLKFMCASVALGDLKLGLNFHTSVKQCHPCVMYGWYGHLCTYIHEISAWDNYSIIPWLAWDWTGTELLNIPVRQMVPVLT